MSSNNNPVKCAVYRSNKKEGMYLYVPAQTQFEEVPESLLAMFGEPGHVMDLALTPERALARVDVNEVMLAVQTQGYFLQMPPGETIPR